MRNQRYSAVGAVINLIPCIGTGSPHSVREQLLDSPCIMMDCHWIELYCKKLPQLEDLKGIWGKRERKSEENKCDGSIPKYQIFENNTFVFKAWPAPSGNLFQVLSK